MKTLYYGGDIITMCDPSDQPEALVAVDQSIAYVGTLEEALKLYPDAEKMDLEGHTLMPAFIDPHSHFMQTAQGINMCDLSATESFEDILQALMTYKKEKQIDKDGVIFATGYDHNFLAEERHPDKYLLDQVSAEIPIYISHASGHMGVANSALLAMAGLNDATPDPEGGKYGRDENGHINGYLEETPALMPVVGRALPLLKFDMPAQIMETQALYLKNGITTVHEGAATKATIDGLNAFDNAGLLQVDVVAYVMDQEYDQAVEAYPEMNAQYKNHVKIGGAKLILDGSPQGKSAWFTRPYEGETDYCGYPTHDETYVTDACQKAIQGGYQIIAHCNGDAASDQFIHCYQNALTAANLPEEDTKDLRPVMIHCQTVREDQLDAMVDIPMLPSIFVGHVWYWGDIHYKNLGEERANRISPVASALRRQMPFTFHQDTPVTKPDMLHSVWCALNRKTRNGRTLGADQAIDVYDALKAITIHGAYAYHEENQKGSLVTGKVADFVILDKNPMKVDSNEIQNIQVLATIKNNIILYKLG